MTDVTVVLARAERQQLVALDVPDGCTAREALALARRAGLDIGDDLDPARVPLGIHGERVEDARVLRDGDRVELYRPLLQDPKERRRRRAAEEARRTGERSAHGPPLRGSTSAQSPGGRAGSSGSSMTRSSITRPSSS